jgi:RNA polymerase sigma-70 factor (ECF subfamily)
MLHDFVMDHIEGRLFISADPARGRFRSLLLTALKNFIISRRRSAGAESRQPKNGLESLDAVIAGGLRMRDLIADSDTPEQIYERSWLLALLTNVLNSLREEYTRKNQLNRFELFERRVVLPILAGTAQPSLRDLAEEAGIDPAEASNCIVTAKRAYQRHLQTEIRAYVSSDKEVSEEISDLFHFLEKLHPGRAS